MRITQTRLARLETAIARQVIARRDGNNFLLSAIATAKLNVQPELAFVNADDTDEATMLDIRATLEWARRDYTEARRLDALKPPDENRFDALLAAEGGNRFRALVRQLNDRTPERIRRDAAMTAALMKGRERMAAAGGRRAAVSAGRTVTPG